MDYKDITPEDIICAEKEAQMNFEREPEEVNEPWDSHGFENAEDYWRWRNR